MKHLLQNKISALALAPVSIAPMMDTGQNLFKGLTISEVCVYLKSPNHKHRLQEFAFTFNQIMIVQLIETFNDESHRSFMRDDEAKSILKLFMKSAGRMYINLDNFPTCSSYSATIFTEALKSYSTYTLDSGEVYFTYFNCLYYDCMYTLFNLALTHANRFAFWGHDDMLLLMNEDFYKNEVNEMPAIQVPIAPIGKWQQSLFYTLWPLMIDELDKVPGASDWIGFTRNLRYVIMLVRPDGHKATFLHEGNKWAGQWAIFEAGSARAILAAVAKAMKLEE